MSALARRAPILLLAVCVLFVALALVLHQVGMDRHEGMGMLGACLALLATALVVLLPEASRLRVQPPIDRSHLPRPASVLLGRPRSRPPPEDEGTVVLC